MHHATRRSLFAIFLVLLLASCQSNPPQPPAQSGSPTPVAAAPTATGAPTLVAAAPTAAQPTPLPATAVPTAVSGLPFPTTTAALPTQLITDSTLARLEPLRSMGVGRAIAAAIAPNKTLLVAATTAGVATFDLPSLTLLRFDAIEGDAYQISVSSDNKLIALVLDPDESGNLATQLRSITSGQLVTTLDGSTPAWNPDGTLLALEQFKDNTSKTQLFRNDGTTFGVLLDGAGASFSPDGSLIATVVSQGNTPETLIYRTSDGSNVAKVAGVAPAWSPDGATLATAVEPEIRLWRMPTGDALGALQTPQTSEYYLVPTLAFSADGKQLHEVNQFDLRTWDLANGSVSQSFPNAIQPAGGADVGGPTIFSPDGAILAVFSPPIEGRFYGVRLIKPESNQQIYSDADSGVLAYSQDSSLAVLVSEEGMVQVVSLSDGTARSLDLPGYTAVAFKPDGSELAAVGTQATLWDVSTNTQQRTLALSDQYGIFGAVRATWSPDGQRLGVETNTGSEGVLFSTANLWDVSGGDLGRTVWERSEGATAEIIMSYSPASGSVASSFDSPEVTLVAGGTLTTTFTLPMTVTALTFNPIGAQLAAADASGAVVLQDQSGDKPTALESGVQGQVTTLAYSSDGVLLAAHVREGANGHIVIWRVGEKQPFATETGDSTVRRLAFTSDGQTLAAAGSGGVSFYRTSDGKELASVKTPAQDISFDPARRLVAIINNERIELYGTP